MVVRRWCFPSQISFNCHISHYVTRTLVTRMIGSVKVRAYRLALDVSGKQPNERPIPVSTLSSLLYIL